jgi:ABC-type antimicrobial peptide transport system permease subunit
MIMGAGTARRLFGDSALGRTMGLPVLRNGETASLEMTLVGIVDDIRYSGIAGEPGDAVYRPFAQQPWQSAFLVVRTDGDADALARQLRREIATVDPGITVGAVDTLAGIVSGEVAQPRFRAVLFGALAALAVVIAVIGLYAVVAYSVSQRTAEFGVRMALGAGRRDILRLVFREGVQLAVAGVVVGLAGARALSSTVGSLLHGVAPTDAASFVLAAGSLFLVAIAATCAPACRASRVDPSVTIRTE